jgi:hypothetical protein
MNREPALKPYTVTIAGFERHDGEKPWTYVVNAESEHDAVATVAAIMATDLGTTDLKFVEIIPGVPPENCGYHWNDARNRNT